jgi:hypothetical protein
MKSKSKSIRGMDVLLIDLNNDDSDAEGQEHDQKEEIYSNNSDMLSQNSRQEKVASDFFGDADGFLNIGGKFKSMRHGKKKI